MLKSIFNNTIMNNKKATYEERIEVLKNSLDNVTNKLIRSYEVIARLNYQNNRMRKQLLNIKKPVSLLIAFCLLIIFLSCEKEAKYCWRCTVVTQYGNAGSYSTNNVRKCDLSTREIELFEQNNNAVCVKDN